MRGFLSTFRQAGRNKRGGSADRRGTRAGESIHEQLTKNHDFLVQPTGASAIIGVRGENSPCRAGQSRFHWRVLHAPCCSSCKAPERGGRQAMYNTVEYDHTEHPLMRITT